MGDRKVAELTTSELKDLIRDAVRQAILELFNDPDEGLELRKVIEKSLIKSESYQTMLASETVLRRDWDRAEEDKAWADL